MVASGGWLAFSSLYSGYIQVFTGYANVFGSVYAVALSMLWLYVCLCIFFFGGAWNAWRNEKNKKF
jgi:membrane protein